MSILQISFNELYYLFDYLLLFLSVYLVNIK